jgi:DNA replication licensing factor MCM2
VKDNLLEEAMPTEVTISQELLKKYILYAKRNIHPKLNEEDSKKIATFYTELRREASAVGGLPIGVRHMESIIRMAEAHAKIHLRNAVIDSDINVAIEMVLTSFLMSQKYAVTKGLERKFTKYLTRGGNTNFLMNLLDRLKQEKVKYLDAIRENGEVNEPAITKGELEYEARSHGIMNLAEFFRTHAFNSKYHIEGKYIKPNN